MPWVEEQPGGPALVQDFLQQCWIPIGRALARHEREEALAIAMKYFTGSAVVPPEARAALEPSLPGVGSADCFAPRFPGAVNQSDQRI